MTPTAIKLKSFQVGKRGLRQLQVTIPQDWRREKNLGADDSVDLLKDTEGRLIVIPSKR